jgi:hypothetical protein
LEFNNKAIASDAMNASMVAPPTCLGNTKSVEEWTVWVEEFPTQFAKGYSACGERRFWPPAVGLGIARKKCAAPLNAQIMRASDSNKHGFSS